MIDTPPTPNPVINEQQPVPRPVKTELHPARAVSEIEAAANGPADNGTDTDIPVSEACKLVVCQKSVINRGVVNGRLSKRPDRDGQRMVLKSEILAFKKKLTAIRQARSKEDGAPVAAPTFSQIETPDISSCPENPKKGTPTLAISRATGHVGETAAIELPQPPATDTPASTSTDQSHPGSSCRAPRATEKVLLTTISFDNTLQVRARIHQDVVSAYAALMRAGQQFRPVELFSGETETFIGDGWHRLLAAKKVGYHTFPAYLHPGGRTAALRWALEANREHGIALSSADKRKIVLLAFGEYPKLSNNEIARICAVSEGLVRKLRDTFVKNEPDQTRIGADGKNYPARKASGNGGVRQTDQPLFKKAVKLVEQLALESLQRLQASIVSLIEQKLKHGSSSRAEAPDVTTSTLPLTNEK